MTRSLDYDKAAAILVDAAYQGDEEAARLWGISERTVKNYRARLADDSRLTLIFREKRALVERDWADALPATIQAAADFIQRAAKQGNPRDPAMVHAVAGGMKLVSEVMFVKQMLDARFKDGRHTLESGTLRPEIGSMVEDGEYIDAGEDA